jgi:hypothetical protein
MNSAECISPLSGDLGSNDDIYRLHARNGQTRKIVRRRNLPTVTSVIQKYAKGKFKIRTWFLSQQSFPNVWVNQGSGFLISPCPHFLETLCAWLLIPPPF